MFFECQHNIGLFVYIVKLRCDVCVYIFCTFSVIRLCGIRTPYLFSLFDIGLRCVFAMFVNVIAVHELWTFVYAGASIYVCSCKHNLSIASKLFEHFAILPVEVASCYNYLRSSVKTDRVVIVRILFNTAANPSKSCLLFM